MVREKTSTTDPNKKEHYAIETLKNIVIIGWSEI